MKHDIDVLLEHLEVLGRHAQVDVEYVAGYGLEAIAKVGLTLAQLVKDLARGDLVEAFVGRVAVLLAYQTVDGAHARARAQELLDEQFAHEAGRARYQHILLIVIVAYGFCHGICDICLFVC